MRKNGGGLASTRKRKNTTHLKRRHGKGFGPIGYILRDTWRNRSRTIFAAAGIASLTLLFMLFNSMDMGLEEYFEEETAGVPTEEEKELYNVKEVMNNWTYLITVICGILMVLVVANTSIITVVERKYELASLRALGISSFQVSIIVIGSMTIIVLAGLLSGLAFGALMVLLLDSAKVSILGGGIGLPLSLDPMLVAYVMALGAISSLVGMAVPLLMLNRRSPLEVLKDD
ncbi:MAG: ABC transporter permease [Thermoplasmatota archaeon]